MSLPNLSIFKGKVTYLGHAIPISAIHEHVHSNSTLVKMNRYPQESETLLDTRIFNLADFCSKLFNAYFLNSYFQRKIRRKLKPGL